MSNYLGALYDKLIGVTHVKEDIDVNNCRTIVYININYNKYKVVIHIVQTRLRDLCRLYLFRSYFNKLEDKVTIILAIQQKITIIL